MNTDKDPTNKVSTRIILASVEGNDFITMFNLPAGKKILDGQYIIDSYLGSGGLGVTYLVRNKSNELFVLKTIQDKYKSAEKFRIDFDREARKLSECRGHPNIVKIVRYFTEDIEETGLNGWPFIVMEYIKGLNLKELIDSRNSPLPETEAINYIRQIGQALVEVIHAKGLVHRDIKPQNIMLRDGINQPVLIDFGLTREFRMSEPKTRTSFISSGYSGIEHIKPKKYQVNNNPFFMDVYSLAATLYFLLTKIHPNDVIDREESIRENKQDSLVPPNKINHKISDAVNEAILKGMSFEPEGRPQTVDDFFKLLDSKLDDNLETTRRIPKQQLTIVSEVNIISQVDPDILKAQANAKDSVVTVLEKPKFEKSQPIKRNLLLAISASIFLGIGALWIVPKSPSLNATYESEQHGFSFKYPKSWDEGKMESSLGETSDIVAEFIIPTDNPEEDNAKFIASVEELNSFNISLNRYVNEVQQQLESNSNIQIIEGVSFIPAPKKEFLQINYVYREEGHEKERTELISINDGKVYTLIYEANADLFSKSDKTINQIYSSFELI